MKATRYFLAAILLGLVLQACGAGSPTSPISSTGSSPVGQAGPPPPPPCQECDGDPDDFTQ